MSTYVIRWGILGTGGIAHLFAQGLASLPDAKLIAVGSRSRETADAFGTLFNIPHRHATYEDLANDPDIDVVYVGTPHTLHKANSLLCLRAGKAVLCEKPFTINAIEAKEVIDYARAHDLFLMEAMWTRYLPLFVRLRELLAEGMIGEVRMIQADFGFRWNDLSHRLFNPAYGGGALLELGVYPVSLASMILGSPVQIASLAHLGETGVDEQSAIVLKHSQGQLALLSSAILTRSPNEAFLLGTRGQIKIHSPWWKATRLTLSQEDSDDVIIEPPFDGNGYNYEAAEVMQCLRSGQCESSIMPLDETLSILQIMDHIRSQWGLRYPGE